MRPPTRLTAVALAGLLSLGAVACDEGELTEDDVGEPETGIAEEEMGDPGEAGGDVPADTGEQDL